MMDTCSGTTWMLSVEVFICRGRRRRCRRSPGPDCVQVRRDLMRLKVDRKARADLHRRRPIHRLAQSTGSDVNRVDVGAYVNAKTGEVLFEGGSDGGGRPIAAGVPVYVLIVAARRGVGSQRRVDQIAVGVEADRSEII
jgi:hypothetical protein